MWPEVVDANLAALAAADRVRQAQGTTASRCGHVPSWLGYAYLQLGQIDKAKSALQACRRSFEAVSEQPSMEMDPDDSMAGAYANMRLRYLLDSGEWSGEVAAWPEPKSAGPGARVDFAFARALGEIAQRHTAAAHDALRELDAVGREIADIETRQGDPDPTYRVRPQIFLLEARGLQAEQDKDLAGAEKQLREAAALEDKLPIAFGPPEIEKPTHELLGEFLLRQGRTRDARAEFELARARTPGRRSVEAGIKASAAAA
jgi:tetratricopeptide (TPR) repeat protein